MCPRPPSQDSARAGQCKTRRQLAVNGDLSARNVTALLPGRRKTFERAVAGGGERRVQAAS